VCAPVVARILLVDDDRIGRLALRATFEQAGFDVLEAGSGAKALLLARELPSLILLDVSLPDIDGFEVCRRIKADPATRSIPILHLSAIYTDSRDRSRGLEWGAEGYLTKPVDPGELLATARALLRLHTAQENVQRTAQQWRSTFDALSDAICLLDPAGIILRCNRAMTELLQRPFARLVGQPYLRVLQDGLKLEQPPALFPAAVLQRETREVRLGERWFLVTTDPIAGPEGLIGSVHVLSDISHRRLMEERLRQRQKMEAVGRLAGGVAHDFNNLLAAILSNITLIKKQSDLPREDYERLTAVEQTAWRGAELTQQLLGFSRQALLWLRPWSINDSLRDVAALLARTLEPRIHLHLRLHPEAGLVLADPTQMNQMLTNLCWNARDAMPEGGHLFLESAPPVIEASSAGGKPDARLDEMVRVSVIDTGEGIPAELLPRIFDPFFTTKPAGKGTGLGLAMVLGIIRQHRGWIECHSQPGAGTRFDLYLPRASREAAPVLVPAAPPVEPAARKTILVADDNEMLRKLASTFLSRNGFQVLLAADGQEALDTYLDQRDHIALVLLDVVMPRLGGLDALRRLRRIDPEVRVILATGYADLEPVEAEREQIQGFVSKPYREHDLIDAVRAALDPSHPCPVAS
jgi:signal transduction histidine kinase